MAKKVQKGGGSALDLAMAAFAGTAAGFVIFAMPDGQFNRVVELSGLPLILPAAQPPLGMTARMAAVAAAALATWTLVWLVLRALGKKPPQAQPLRRARPAQIEVPLPRLRRADAHPDAPARRPILAGLELGTPLNDLHDPADETGPVEEAAPEEAQEEQIVEEDPTPDRPVLSCMDAEDEPGDEARSEEADAGEALEIPEVRDSVAPDAPAGEHEQTSISHLMQRLELGLLRREHPSWAASAQPTPQNRELPRQIDQRLRSAIDDLQRLAARGG